MFEDDMHFRPLHTSILNINKVFEPWVCCLKCMWVHPYTVTPAKLAPDLVIIGPFSTVKMMPLRHSWGCQPPQSTTHILIRHKQSVLVIGMLSQGNMGAPFYRYTGQVGPRFVKSGSLVEWKWCHYIMAEADINLRPFHFSYIHIWHIQRVWAIGMLSQGHVGAPLYHYTGQVGTRFWDLGSLMEWKWCHHLTRCQCWSITINCFFWVLLLLVTIKLIS